jgi:GxxExxY protein
MDICPWMERSSEIMTPNDVAKVIVDAALKVHVTLGPGLLESAYEAVLAYELEQRGLRVRRQQPFGIVYESLTVNDAFRADLVVEDQVMIELKSVESVHPVHKKQLLTYLRLSGKPSASSSTLALAFFATA